MKKTHACNNNQKHLTLSSDSYASTYSIKRKQSKYIHQVKEAGFLSHIFQHGAYLSVSQ